MKPWATAPPRRPGSGGPPDSVHINRVHHKSVPDPRHSDAEVRFKAVGRTRTGRAVLVVFTLRPGADGTRIRPISARFMHRKEVAYYEEEITRSDQ
ncbi:MAG: BrnT family toxin [Acetobacteraceae bacterium]